MLFNQLAWPGIDAGTPEHAVKPTHFAFLVRTMSAPSVVIGMVVRDSGVVRSKSWDERSGAG